MTFEEVEAKFNSVWKQMEDFIPMGSKEEAKRINRKGLNLEQKSEKKQKTSEEVLEEAMSFEEVPKEKDKEIFMLVEKDYPLRKGLALVMINYKLQVENYSQMANDLILKIYKIVNSPRQQEEILAFIHFLGHSAAIRTLIDVNINKLYQPWRSFAAIINKCLTEKSSGYDSLRISQAQILRNKVNWNYVRDDHMLSTIKLVSRHQNTQQFSALLPIELTNAEIRNSKAYKEYYTIAIGEAAPKPKASVKRTRSSSNTSITPPTAAASPRLTASAKGKQTAKASKAKSLSALSEPSGSGADEGTGSKLGVPDVPTDESEEELSWNSTDDEGDDNKEKDDDGDEEDEVDDGEEGNGDDDDADQEVVRDDDKDDDKEGGEDIGLNVEREEGLNEEEEEDKLYRDANINQGRGIQATLEVEDTHVTLTPVNPDGQQESSSVSSQFVTSMLNPTLDVGMESSHSSRTSYAVAIDLFKMELKNILIKKIKGNKSIYRSDEQRNLYKALVEAYESDKIILDTYKETVTLKRRRNDDADKDEEPSAGPDRGSKRRREGKEPESASAPTETATRSAGRSTQGSRSRQALASESALAE
nr:hypothetical protein [Tanacetum cinerariifolium]